MAIEFLIDEIPFPFIGMDDFLFQDWALIRDITGLSSEAFVLAHNDDGDMDLLVLYGYAAVSFWHRNPQLTRQRIAAHVGDWREDVVAIRNTDPEPADDAAPLAAPEGGSSSSEDPSLTSNGPNGGPAGHSASMDLISGGADGQPVGSPA